MMGTLGCISLRFFFFFLVYVFVPPKFSIKSIFQCKHTHQNENEEISFKSVEELCYAYK